MLTYLGKNARMSSGEIERNLRAMGYSITQRAIRYRLQKLESHNTVLGYSSILNPNFVSDKINGQIILKIKYSHNSSSLIDRLQNYVQEASFCVYSARLSGDFDWIFHFAFDSIEQFELEINNLVHLLSETDSRLSFLRI